MCVIKADPETLVPLCRVLVLTGLTAGQSFQQRPAAACEEQGISVLEGHERQRNSLSPEAAVK